MVIRHRQNTLYQLAYSSFPLSLSALAVLYAAFLAASRNAYAHPIFIYKQARDLNTKISAAFLPDASDSAVDSSLYPNQDGLRMLLGYLFRYHLSLCRGDAPK